MIQLDPVLRQTLLDRLDQHDDGYATPSDLAAVIDPRTVRTPALDLIDQTLTNLPPDGRLIISMPPQEGKSTRAAHDYPLWVLTQEPDTRIAIASYAQNLAQRNGRKLRNTVTAHPELGLRIARDNGSAAEWELADHDGGVLSVGRGAGITGRAVDLLIIDDPLKDRQEADSKTIRDVAWDWWTDALSTRLGPGARVVLILTRWHEDDLAGRLMAGPDGDRWQVLNIPAQAETDQDPLGREPGEYLTSARGDRDWEAIKTQVGSRTWQALYQGNPSPPAGGIFQRDWWQLYDQPPAGGDYIQSWDLSFKGADTSDYVVGQVWQRTGSHAWLIDQVRGRYGFTDTVEQIKTMAAKHPYAFRILVEDKANGPAVIDALRNDLPGVIPVNPQGGKEARANAVTAFIEAGNIHLPRHAAFTTELIEEAAGFPNATHDDQVDALTQALTYLFITQPLRSGGTIALS